MQDKYAGDIGDFGKFVMLRELVRHTHFRLGINWYLTDKPEPSSNDGRHVSYLNPEHQHAGSFKRCDPQIYHSLNKIVTGGRSVRAMEKAGILPANTIFFAEPLPYPDIPPHHKMETRERWFSRSLDALRQAEIIFMDPDNGIQSPKVRKTHSRAIKYVFTDEILCTFAQCKILIVYHHRNRSPNDLYIRKFTDVRIELGANTRLRVLRFKRVSVRDYLFFFRKSEQPPIEKLFSILTGAPSVFLFEELII